jgi:hypothetical protein
MGRKVRFTIDQLEAALRSQGGIQSAAAKVLEEASGRAVQRSLISQAVARSPRLQQAIAETTESVLDLAENVIVQALNNGDVNAAKFVLETRGKQRGYTRRIDAMMTASLNLNVTVTEARRAFYEELDQMAARRRAVMGGRAGGAEPNGLDGA